MVMPSPEMATAEGERNVVQGQRPRMESVASPEYEVPFQWIFPREPEEANHGSLASQASR